MTEKRFDISLLSPYQPSATALLDWLQPHITNSMLQEIADADYGCEAEAYFKALGAIRDDQAIPVPLDWIPREVLELIRWSEPDDLTRQNISTGRRGHLIRAFCCAVLLQAADEHETAENILAENDTLIQLVASVLFLGREASENALRLFCWRIPRLSVNNDEVPFFLMAVFLLRVALFEPHQEETNLILLAEWIVTEEARCHSVFTTKSEDWLLGLTFHDQRHEVWKKLATEILLDPKKSFSGSTTTALQNIVTRLVYGSG